MAKLSVHLVAWNGAKYIPYLFESLRAQTYKDWELLAIDNASAKDNTADLIEQELENFSVLARLIRNKTNTGFAPGHNQAVQIVCHPERSEGSLHSDMASASHEQGVEISRSARNDNIVYIQLLNQDMYLAPDYFEKVVAMMDAHPEAGAGQGLLLRWHNPTQPACPAGRPPSPRLRESEAGLTLRGGEEGLLDVIDTMGLKVMRNRRVVDWRTGENIQSVISNEVRNLTSSIRQGEEIFRYARNDEVGTVEVFGVSGALPVYRRKAVEEVMFEDKMFDEDFFMYKEDVDLAFRLRSAGWKTYIAPEARAWHDRTAAGPREMSDKSAVQNRKSRPAYVNRYSYRNHLIVLLKNEHCVNFAKDWLWIVWYEIKKFIYLVFTDWATLKGLGEVYKLWPRIMAKRKQIMNNYKVKPEEMRRWFM